MYTGIFGGPLGPDNGGLGRRSSEGNGTSSYQSRLMDMAPYLTSHPKIDVEEIISKYVNGNQQNKSEHFSVDSSFFRGTFIEAIARDVFAPLEKYCPQCAKEQTNIFVEIEKVCVYKKRTLK